VRDYRSTVFFLHLPPAAAAGCAALLSSYCDLAVLSLTCGRGEPTFKTQMRAIAYCISAKVAVLLQPWRVHSIITVREEMQQRPAWKGCNFGRKEVEAERCLCKRENIACVLYLWGKESLHQQCLPEAQKSLYKIVYLPSSVMLATGKAGGFRLRSFSKEMTTKRMMVARMSMHGSCDVNAGLL